MTRAGFLAVLLGTVIAQPALTQQPGRRYGETDLFRFLLQAHQIEPLRDFDALEVDPDQNALFIFGNTQFLDEQSRVEDLRRLIRMGLRVVIATDFVTSQRFADELGVKISGEFVKTPQNSKLAYRGMLVDCPIIRMPPRPALGADDDIFGGLEIATNKPSYISRYTDQLWRLAEFPPGLVGEDGKETRISLPFAVSGEIGSGQFIVIADHSVFINEMLAAGDNQNLQLAIRLIRWATQGGKRSQVLFVEEASIWQHFPDTIEQFDFPFPPPEVLVQIANHAIAGLEQEDFFNRLLLEIVPHRQIMRVLALVGTVLLALFGLYCLLRSKYRADPKVPRLPERLTVMTGDATAGERRRQALLRGGNLAETARELARQTFRQLNPDSSATPAGVRVHGPWWQRVSWRWRVSRLSQLAEGRGYPAVSPRRLLKIARELSWLRTAAQTGAIELS